LLEYNTAVILYLSILAIVNYNGFEWSTIISIIVMLLPAGVIAIELSGKKVSLLLILPALFHHGRVLPGEYSVQWHVD